MDFKRENGEIYVTRPADFRGTNDAWQCVECHAIWSTSDRLMSPHVITNLPGHPVPVITPFMIALRNAYSVNGLDSVLRMCKGGNARALVLVSKVQVVCQHCTCYKTLNEPCCHCGIVAQKLYTSSDAFANAVEPVTITIPAKPSEETARALLADDLLPEVMGLLNGLQLNDVEYELALAVARYFRMKKIMKKYPLPSELGEPLTAKQWQKLADLLMYARHDPGIPDENEGDRNVFQHARHIAVFHLGRASRKDRQASE